MPERCNSDAIGPAENGIKHPIRKRWILFSSSTLSEIKANPIVRGGVQILGTILV
jgi:hypothetical protein